MSNDPFEEARRRFLEAMRLHHEKTDAAQRHITDALRKALRDPLATIRNFPEPKARKRRRDGEPDIGGVPVEPNNPRNLSGGAAAVPETEP